MDASQSKAPDFAVDSSPPFSFDLQSDSSEAFTGYGGSVFQEGSSDVLYPQWHPSQGTGASGSAGMPVETPNIGIPPTLTYGNLGPENMYQHALTSSVNSDSTDGTTARGHTAGGKRRSARPAARKSATTTRRQVRDQDAGLSDDEEGEGNGYVTQRHSEETRLQRMESEQRRRNELRNGYARLKSALPISNQKSSKISLLDRAITYIRQLETGQNNLQTQLQNTERELDRQRGINEGLIRAITDPTRLSPARLINASDSASVLSHIVPGDSAQKKN